MIGSEPQRGWDLSIQRILDLNLSQRLVLRRCFTYLPVVAPYQPLAVHSVRVSHVGCRTIIRVLALRGWALDMSLMMFRNFRMFHPELKFNVAAYALMTRSQLREEFGATFGDLIADIHVDPTCQPVWTALFNGQLDVLISRAPSLLDLTIDQTFSGDTEPSFTLHPGACQSMGFKDAQMMHAELTGLPAPDFVISLDPRTHDYGNLAEGAVR